MKVIIIGGGVGGLTAAHELVHRGFDVDVYELNDIPGGKARSFWVPPEDYAPAAGKKPLPAEHGFRFFPGFYQHIVDTMAEIDADPGKSVADNLVRVEHLNYGRFGKDLQSVSTQLPRSPLELLELLNAWVKLDVPPHELLAYVNAVWRLLTSCTERVIEQYEMESWWDFLKADHKSQNFKRLLPGGTRVLVAADPKLASAKTNGLVLERLLVNQSEGRADRVLNGPTSLAWLFPWLIHLLRYKNFRYFVNAEVTGIDASEQTGRVEGVAIKHRCEQTARFSRVESCHPQDGPTYIELNLPTAPITGDRYVCAVPVEVMAGFLAAPGLEHEPRESENSDWSAVARIDPALKHIWTLSKDVRWMNGIMFYLKGDAPRIEGHTAHTDASFALSSVMQAQYWAPQYSLDHYGRGNLRDICSVDISNWLDTEPHIDPTRCDIPYCGRGRKNHLSARDTFRLGAQQLKDEVWQDIKDSMRLKGGPCFSDDNLEYCFLDPAICWNGTEVVNREPLLVNQRNTWSHRPEARTRVVNLYLASDYVRSETDLATMEAACEVAKTAVNCILRDEGSPAAPCKLHKLQRASGFPFDELRAWDLMRYKQGGRHSMDEDSKS